MERARQLIHLVPRDAALIRILKIETQVLCVIDRLFQFIPNLTLLARGGLSSAHDTRQDANRLGEQHLCYIKVWRL